MQWSNSLSQIKQMNNNEFRSIQIKPLEYQSTLAKQLFSHIESVPWAMLATPASESHVDSRYDILVASTHRHLRDNRKNDRQC